MRVVDRIEPYKGKTCAVVFTDGARVYLHGEIAAQYSLSEGTRIPDEALEEIIRTDTLRRARQRALFLIDAREYSYTGLYEKLQANYPDDVCFAVLDELVRGGQVNDRRYAQQLARTLTEVKKLGFYRARQEMRMKGISSELAEEALAEYEDDASARLAELIRRKYLRKLEAENGRQKVVAALARLGYAYEEIRAALDEIEEE
ncbi:MAG: regulatory protein RecX [Oscillospiraceae bacterium]